MDQAALEVLGRSGVNQHALESVVIPHLYDLGVERFEDLAHIERDDLTKIEGISEIDRRKLFSSVRATKRGDLNHRNIDSNDSEQDSSDSVIVKYIVLDVDYAVAADYLEIPKLNPSLKDLMEHLVTKIVLPDDELIELYSEDGYPLHNNSFMNKVSLEKWKVNNTELFVIKRKKNQLNQQKFATLPALDHEIGEETFHVETGFHGDFSVKAYMDSDSPEDIAQKIYSLTDIEVPYMSLYVRRGYNHERLDPFTELQDNDIIRVVLRDPQELIQPQSTHYGCRSYNQMVNQTDLGMSKFYSILKFLCCPQSMTTDYDFNKLLTCLLNVFGFPPLVYSLRLLYEQSSLSIPGWAALIEGCYIFFKRLLCSFGCSKVPDNRVFELSDYIWAYLVEQSKSVTDSSITEAEQLSLVCPLSGTRILSPVRIFGFDGGPFDKENVKEKIKERGEFTDIGYDKLVQKEDIIEDAETELLLMYFHWEHHRRVYKWQNHIKVDIDQLCKEIDVKMKWYELPNLLCNLSIVNPAGLFAGNKCLTYINNGRLVYFFGASKGDDENRKIYDPISELKEYSCSVNKQVMDGYGSKCIEANVTCDLTQFVSPVQPEIQSGLDFARINAIIKPLEAIQWDPEEAIVVLLDHSGSMTEEIYTELGSMTRLQAAKELFNAFVTRTQAYHFHHSFGLTLFNTYVTVKLPITKNSEEFEMSLKDLQVDHRTALADAMMSGIDQLQHYNCTRRIICLTDGDDNESTYSYSDVLTNAKQFNVIIDSILITGPGGNQEQKNISHNTGGVCVLPTSMNEALSFFEMDTMLSVKERKPISVMTYPYWRRPFETKNDFKSKVIDEFKRMKTTSAKRFFSLTNSQYCQKRILKELREIIQYPHPDFEVFPIYESFDCWKVLMKGPCNTAYENGVFELIVKFPSKYPSVPPEIRFLTPIYHCNISSSSGRVCHSILGSGYTPATSMRTILSHVYGLLMCPDVDTPLDSTLAVKYGYSSHNEKNLNKPFPYLEYFGEADDYFSEARSQVRLHASTSFQDKEKELDGLLLI